MGTAVIPALLVIFLGLCAFTSKNKKQTQK